MHCDMFVAPVTPLVVVNSGHSEQSARDDLPVLGVYVFSGHGLHIIDPRASWYVPDSHDLHLPPSQKVPSPHVSQADDSLELIKPPGQPEHNKFEEFSEYMPDEHILHSAEPFSP